MPEVEISIHKNSKPNTLFSESATKDWGISILLILVSTMTAVDFALTASKRFLGLPSIPWVQWKTSDQPTVSNIWSFTRHYLETPYKHSQKQYKSRPLTPMPAHLRSTWRRGAPDPTTIKTLRTILIILVPSIDNVRFPPLTMRIPITPAPSPSQTRGTVV